MQHFWISTPPAEAQSTIKHVPHACMLPALAVGFWSWTFSVFYHYWSVNSWHCSCPLVHGEAFVYDRWQAFHRCSNLPIPREEDPRIQPSSADILDIGAAVFSQLWNCWHVFLKTGSWSPRTKAPTIQSAFVVGWCSACWFCWINTGIDFILKIDK